ncbi:MAG TPA: aminotransferase class III-fold pyridoxal phosphate-dependent enzyme [Myxococcota bacterium]|nr:aminotransferase class III-fold pyridoxal phosphate-dependent enzyme [Myxococcota bacterium]HPB50725.1 aminotransferase class III-fold pyridoxal phosphate-dependent enzyme [Myxococcota bacterium]HQP95797.1 aminotransferase class III-fold pyridoxal phosphate-dependent enzyme [Myxococcota bacterium]
MSDNSTPSGWRGNEASRQLFSRALKVIPTGIPGHQGPVESQFIPVSSYPFYVDRAQDSYFWDIDGNRYIDYMCAYGPNVLGYNNRVVDAAVDEQRRRGDCMALPSARQVELAELLVETIEIADWAYFAKNGGDVTQLAMMVSRAATGRKKIVLVRGGYHGVAPWTQKVGKPGITPEDVANNLYVDWNDFEQFEALVRDNPGQIAMFMATPYHHPVFQDNELPAEGYWQKVQKLCNEKGIVLVVDDIRAGFRLSLAGSANYFGFKPDMACYCKAIANGQSISALVGTNALRSAVSDVFYTGSYWASSAAMAGAIATVNELKRLDGANLMLAKGRRLTEGMEAAAADVGLNLKVSGIPSMFYMRITNDDSLQMSQEFCAETAMRGVFFVSHHNHFINCSLTDADIEQTIQISHEAFKVVSERHR